MRKRVLGFSIALVLFSTFVSVSAFIAQTRIRPTTERPLAGDLKVKYKVTMSGQMRESTTMIKGPRERSEEHSGYGSDTVNITQRDLKRTIQISFDIFLTFFIWSFERVVLGLRSWDLGLCVCLFDPPRVVIRSPLQDLRPKTS